MAAMGGMHEQHLLNLTMSQLYTSLIRFFLSFLFPYLEALKPLAWRTWEVAVGFTFYVFFSAKCV